MLDGGEAITTLIIMLLNTAEAKCDPSLLSQDSAFEKSL